MVELKTKAYPFIPLSGNSKQVRHYLEMEKQSTENTEDIWYGTGKERMQNCSMVIFLTVLIVVYFWSAVSKQV